MTIFHRSFTFLALVFSIPVTGALTGCVGPVTNLYPPGADDPVREFYVVSHGWHTGIVIDRDDVPQKVWPEHSRLKNISSSKSAGATKHGIVQTRPHAAYC